MRDYGIPLIGRNKREHAMSPILVLAKLNPIMTNQISEVSQFLGVGPKSLLVMHKRRVSEFNLIAVETLKILNLSRNQMRIGKQLVKLSLS